MMMGDVKGGDVTQEGSATATGASFNFDFKFDGMDKMGGFGGDKGGKTESKKPSMPGLMNLGSVFGGHSESKHKVDQKVNFAPIVGKNAKFMMNGNVKGGDVSQSGDASATGASFNFDFKLDGMGGMEGMGGDKKGGDKKSKKASMPGLLNLGSIFGGHGESKHNVDQKVNFKPKVAKGAQFMMMDNVTAGNVGQNGDAKAEGTKFDFDFKFSKPETPAAILLI